MLRLGIVGCGDVAQRYARTLAPYPELPIVAATDVDAARAAAFAAEWGGELQATLDDLLADDRVDCVLNLTPFELHADVTARALEAGKHVHTREAARARRRECAQARRARRAHRPAAQLLADHVPRAAAADGAASAS